MRCRSTMLALIAILASCSKGEVASQQNSTTHKQPSPVELANAEYDDRSQALKAASIAMQNELVAAANSAKAYAEEHASKVRSKMLDDQSYILSRSDFYARTGGAGLAARFSREEEMRDQAVRGLKQSKAILEEVLRIEVQQRDFLQMVKTEAPADQLASVSLGAYDDTLHLKRLVESAGGVIKNSDAIGIAWDSLNEAVITYNSEARKNSRPVVKIPSRSSAEPAERTLNETAAPSQTQNPGGLEPGVPDVPFTASEKRQIEKWGDLNNSCRGGTVPAEELAAVCAQRDKQVSDMADNGLCYGRRSDEASAQHRWHRCTEDSYQ